MSYLSNSQKYLLIVTASVFLFFPFLGSVHLFDWDEINFAESAREMLVTGNFARVQINFQPFWEKPPLFFWIQALCMKIFGVNEFAARFPNAVTGIVTLILIFKIGKKHLSERIAWLWVISYAGSITPHLYFKTGIIDPLFNLFIFLGIYQLYLSTLQEKNNRSKQFLLSGIFLGLAVLTKGPVALLLAGATGLVYWIRIRFSPFFSIKDLAILAIVILAISFAWFGLETVQNGPWFIAEFIRYQIELFSEPVATHGQPFYYHFVVLLMGCFPASIPAIRGFFIKSENSAPDFIFWMRTLFWVVLIIFSLVTTKIVHYSSMCYLPLTLMSALALNELLEKKNKFSPVLFLLLILIGSILIIGLILITLIPYLDPDIFTIIKDPFVHANLSVPVTWDGFEFIVPTVYLGIFIYCMTRISIKKYLEGFIILFTGTALLMQWYMPLVVPKMESYIQGGPINFYISLAGKNVYVDALGFKSYAPYFYAKTQPPSTERHFLLNGKIDKDAYFVCKEQNAEQYKSEFGLQEISRAGGFVYLKRKAVLR